MQITRAYLAISYSDRHQLDAEIYYLVKKAKEVGVEVFVFVNHYNFKKNQEIEMMKTAFDEIDNSTVFIAELTEKSIGVGIELGYAFANKKSIIYLRKKGSEYSTTAAGSSNFIMEYTDKVELLAKVLTAIRTIRKEEKN
jgi:nucleoside 2-deoxyribosyltransferase